MGKERATVMVCDNPSCGVTRITSKEEPALGIYLGKGYWAGGGGGGPIPSIYVCSQECLAPAVQEAIEGDL